MTSIPGSGHNHPPRDWLDVLRALIRKLRGWLSEAVRMALRLVETPALVRRVDVALADDLRRVERHSALTDEDRHAVARAAAVARGDVP